MVLLWIAFLFFLLCCPGSGSPNKCDEVRKLFHHRPIGAGQPSGPGAESELQVCVSKNLSCCTKKMEEKYQLVARRDIQNLLQSSSSKLKSLISQNVAAFQDTFEVLLKQAENHTNVFLRRSYRSVADEAAGPVGELFTAVGLFLMGSELSVDESVQRFFDALFPPVYGRLVRPALGDLSPSFAECVRSSRRDLKPFGATPGILVEQIVQSGVAGKLFLQALHLGLEVINTTDHLQMSRECRRAILKMQYCPFCQGLTQSKPCMGYCLNVMRGCLASMAEIDTHWREFVHSLEGLSARMHGPQDLEQVLLGAHTLLRDAIGHAQRNAARLSAQVQKLCGSLSGRSAQAVSPQQGSSRESIPLKTLVRGSGDSLAIKRRDFLNSLRPCRTHYGGLADHLCMSELASGDGLSCWNGIDAVKSYTLRVVGSGIKAQSSNPEVKVKVVDPVVNQIIDKLRHINQLLQGKSIPKLGSLDQIETGSGDAEGRHSGDCDDEDGCGSSGGGESRRKNHRVVKREGVMEATSPPEKLSVTPLSGDPGRVRPVSAASRRFVSPDVAADQNHHHHRHRPPAEERELTGRSGSLGLTPAVFVLTWLHTLWAL